MAGALDYVDEVLDSWDLLLLDPQLVVVVAELADPGCVVGGQGQQGARGLNQSCLFFGRGLLDFHRGREDRFLHLLGNHRQPFFLQKCFLVFSLIHKLGVFVETDLALLTEEWISCSNVLLRLFGLVKGDHKDIEISNGSLFFRLDVGSCGCFSG